jgi:hypothetical protein
MPVVAFELTLPGSERPQTHVLDRADIGVGAYLCYDTRK